MTEEWRLCEMERLSLNGLCGNPAIALWTHKEGKTLVCQKCLPSVMANHGNLTSLIHSPTEEVTK